MTTTPNPTAEKVIADAITAYWADEERSGPNRGPEAHDRECGIDAAKALRAHGLLSEGAPQALDPVKVAEVLKIAKRSWHDMGGGPSLVEHITDALCEAYKEGKLT